MSETMSTYLPMLVIGALILVLVVGFVVRPGQRIRLNSDDTPERPHIAHSYNLGRTGEGKGLVDEGAAAMTDVAGQAMQVKAHDHLPGATGAPDDLTRLKGVGPKLAAMLNAKGILRYDQLASLTPAQVETMSADFGAFKGRIARDRVVEQAHYLARGDTDGYELKFGKL